MVKCKLNITREKNSNVKKKKTIEKMMKKQKMYPPYKIPEVDILNIALVGPLITVIWFKSKGWINNFL